MKKREGLFLAICALAIVIALVLSLGTMHSETPLVDYHEFEILVRYEEHGEAKTKTLTYCGAYTQSEKTWSGYYKENGMSDMVTMDIFADGEWAFVLELNAGYLMGDPRYAGYYDNGLPEPMIAYHDGEGNEYSGVIEAEPFGIVLLDCEYPEPIANEYVTVDAGPGYLLVAVLTGLAAMVLLAGLVLVKKKDDVMYGDIDRMSQLLNWLVGLIATPIFLVIGPAWEVLPEKGWTAILGALMAPITLIGVCASILLRRKGKSKLGMAAQFVGPAVFFGLMTAYVLVGFGYGMLFMVAGVAAGVLIAVLSKRDVTVAHKPSDWICVVCNIVLIPVYFMLSLLFLFMGGITEAASNATAMQVILCNVVAFVIAAVPVYCGVSLGLSAAFGKKGKRTAAFMVQFAGFAGMILVVILIAVCELLPWISMTIN